MCLSTARQTRNITYTYGVNRTLARLRFGGAYVCSSLENLTALSISRREIAIKGGKAVNLIAICICTILV